MPARVLADAIPPGRRAAGALADCVVPGVNLSVVDRVDGLPRTCTFGAMVCVEGGGNPIPEPGREHLALREVRIEEASSDLVIEGPVDLKPYGGMFAPAVRQECVGIPLKRRLLRNGQMPGARNPEE